MTNNINITILPDEFYFDWIKELEEEFVCMAQLSL